MCQLFSSILCLVSWKVVFFSLIPCIIQQIKRLWEVVEKILNWAILFAFFDYFYFNFNNLFSLISSLLWMSKWNSLSAVSSLESIGSIFIREFCLIDKTTIANQLCFYCIAIQFCCYLLLLLLLLLPYVQDFDAWYVCKCICDSPFLKCKMWVFSSNSFLLCWFQ